MYSEFVAGTNCRENEHNYQIFRGIEIIYNNTESMTKEQAYEMALPFIEGRLSEEERSMVALIDGMISDRLDEMADLILDLERADRRMAEALDSTADIITDEAMGEYLDAEEDHEATERDLMRNAAERRLLDRIREDITSGRYQE